MFPEKYDPETARSQRVTRKMAANRMRRYDAQSFIERNFGKVFALTAFVSIGTFVMVVVIALHFILKYW